MFSVLQRYLQTASNVCWGVGSGKFLGKDSVKTSANVRILYWSISYAEGFHHASSCKSKK